MEIKLTPKSNSVIAKINVLGATHKKNIEQALKDILPDVMKEVKRLIRNTKKTGRKYPFRGGVHTASAPGEPPATRTGRLYRSTNYGVRNWEEAYLGESVDYALYQEKGTRKSSRHAGIIKRPHLIAAINNKMGDTYMALVKAGNV